MKLKMIVIGGGIGGLSVAVELLCRDIEVIVLEKNPQLGGRAGSWREGDYRWPNGACAVIDPDKYKAPFERAGKSWPDYFTMERIKMPYRWQQDKETRFFADDVEMTLERVYQQSPKSVRGYLDYLSDAKGRYDLAGQYERYGFGGDAASSSGSLLKKYAMDSDLQQWLTFLAAYPGGEMKLQPTVTGMQPAVMQLFGIWQIEGGMAAYAEALAKLVRELGGEIHCGESAEEIIIAGHRAVGVKTSRELYLGCGVVSAVDYHYCLKHLLPERIEDFYQRTEEDFQHSCGVFALYLLTEGDHSRLAAHNLASGRQLSSELQAAYRGKYLRRPPIYLYQLPAEAGRWQQMCVYCRVPNSLKRPKHWTSKEKARQIKRIMGTLERMTGLEELPQQVRAMFCVTPEDFDRRYHAIGGAAFGLSGGESLWQVKGVQNLYFVGDSVSGGAGVHRVLEHSARSAKKITQVLTAL